jgi:hypothetical protein
MMIKIIAIDTYPLVLPVKEFTAALKRSASGSCHLYRFPKTDS